MRAGGTRDFFDRARSVAASVMFAAAAAAALGAFLDWLVVAEVPGRVPEAQAGRLPPLTGIELGDGYWVLGAAVVMGLSAALVVLRAAAGWSWLAFLASVVVGAIGVADYRGISELFVEFDAIGRDPQPGLGLLLVIAAAGIGIVAAVAGVAASPRRS